MWPCLREISECWGAKNGSIWIIFQFQKIELIFGTNDVLIKSFRFLLTFNKVNSKSPNSLIAPSTSTLKTSFMTSIMIHWGSSMYYVNTFLDLFWPTHYFTINTLLNVSKNCHFMNLDIRQPTQPSSPFADLMYGWSLSWCKTKENYFFYALPLCTVSK